MNFPPVLSTIPESHVICSRKEAESGKLSFRTDGKGREFISFRDDASRLEWKISRSHADASKVCAHITEWMSSQDLNVSCLVTVPDERASVFAKEQIELVEAVCSSFLVGKSLGDISASAWQVVGDDLDDLLSSGSPFSHASSFSSDEVVPETNSVRIKSVLDFQRLVRRVERYSDLRGAVFIRFVLFKESRIVHLAFMHAQLASASLTIVPTIRAAKKSGTQPRSHPLTLTQKCIVPLLSGNAKPFIVIDTSTLNDSNAVIFQSLFDVSEKICLTALPCQREAGGLRIEEFDVIESIDKLPPRKKKGERTQSVLSIDNSSDESKISARKKNLGAKKISPPPVYTEAQLVEDIDQLDLELTKLNSNEEVEELRSKNLVLKSELDKAAVGSGGNAYTGHLVNEVKQLRQELAAVETERRKYQTSKRLIDSLVEKSNKMKVELGQKSAKIDDMKKSDSVLKHELAELKQNCEYLLDTNRRLNVDLEEAQSVPAAKPVSIDSFYHEFLFPFGRKREMEKSFLSLHDLLHRIERNVAVNCPSSVLDVRKSGAQLEKLKDSVNELLSASEKLEISAATLIKSHANRGRPSTTTKTRSS